MLLRGHGGKAWFRNPELHVIRTPAGACLFDGLPVTPRGPAREGFRCATWRRVRISYGSSERGWGLKLDVTRVPAPRGEGTEPGRDPLPTPPARTAPSRCSMLSRSMPRRLRWLDGPRQSTAYSPFANTSTLRSFTSAPTAGYHATRWVPWLTIGRARRSPSTGGGRPFPHRLQLRQRRIVPGLRLRPDRREAERAAVRFIPLALIPSGVSARRWPATTKSVRSRSAAASPGRSVDAVCQDQCACGAGRILVSASRKATTRPNGTTEHDILTFRYTEPMTWWMPLPEGHAADHGSGVGRGPASGHPGPPGSQGPVYQRLSRCRGPSSRPACSTRPGATARCGA